MAFKYDFRALAAPLIPIHSFVSLKLFVRSLQRSTSRDVMSAQRYRAPHTCLKIDVRKAFGD